MNNKNYTTISDLAQLFGLSRVAVWKRIKKGQIKAEKIGNMFVITDKEVAHILGKIPTDADKSQIEKAVKLAMKDYGEVLRKLGRE
jgi:hypothetical protein